MDQSHHQIPGWKHHGPSHCARRPELAPSQPFANGDHSCVPWLRDHGQWNGKQVNLYIPNDSPETNKAVKQLWHQSNMIAIPYSNSQSSSVLNGIGSLRWSATECGPLPQWDTGRHHRSFCEGIQGSLPRMGLARQAGANQFQQKWTSNDDIATYSQKRLVKRIMIPNQLMQLGNIELEVKLSHPLTIFFRIHLRTLERLQPCPWIPRGWTIT
jgi:hypothetical protein